MLTGVVSSQEVMQRASPGGIALPNSCESAAKPRRRTAADHAASEVRLGGSRQAEPVGIEHSQHQSQTARRFEHAGNIPPRSEIWNSKTRLGMPQVQTPAVTHQQRAENIFLRSAPISTWG